MQLGRLPLYQLSYSRNVGNNHFTRSLEMVVREGFEPSKLSQQSYSLPPLAARESHQYRTYLQCRSSLNQLNTLKWCRHTDSNCGPTDYKSVALPTELCRRFLVFRTFRIGTVCSLAKLPNDASGFLKKTAKNS